MAKRVTIICVLSVLLTTGCAINPVSGENQLRIITAEQEISIGTNIDTEVRGQYPPVTGTPAAERVQRIGEKIAAVSDRRDVPYRFTLIESNQLNAFAAPGGFIYVTTETERVAATDAELAAVIAHEVGHVAALHSVNQMQRAHGYHYLSALVFGENQEEVKEAADIAFNSVIMTGFSRQDELQADDLGVKYSSIAPRL